MFFHTAVNLASSCKRSLLALFTLSFLQRCSPAFIFHLLSAWHMYRASSKSLSRGMNLDPIYLGSSPKLSCNNLLKFRYTFNLKGLYHGSTTQNCYLRQNILKCGRKISIEFLAGKDTHSTLLAMDSR